MRASTAISAFSPAPEEFADGVRLQLVPEGAVTPPDTFYARYGKRAVDLAFAIPILLVLAIPMLLIAAAIRMDTPGSPIFVQTRIGRDGSPFRILKYRTMAVAPRSEFLLLMDDDGELRHKVRNDPRVTRLGRALRYSSLDELPQLINVIRGEMSLVGPRPELPQIVDTYEPWQHARHTVRPGITGWWQVSGRSDLPMHEHTDLDLFYVVRMSPQLDVSIVRRSLAVVFRGIGAF